MEFAWKFVFTVLMIDVVFYWMHRFMHENKTVYKWCHSKHHLLGAKHTVWGGLDVDFLETLSIFWYLTLPFLFVSVTPEFCTLLLVAGAFQTALIHGTKGSFPPWPICNANFHHGHHMYRTKNYAATFTFLDEILGTARVSKESSKPEWALFIILCDCTWLQCNVIPPNDALISVNRRWLLTFLS